MEFNPEVIFSLSFLIWGRMCANLDFNIWQILILSPHHNTANWLYQMFYHYNNLCWDWNTEIDDLNSLHSTFLLAPRKWLSAVGPFVPQFYQLSFDWLLVENLQELQFDDSVFEIEPRLELRLDNVQKTSPLLLLWLLKMSFLQDLESFSL